jgi:hypothetical protein
MVSNRVRTAIAVWAAAIAMSGMACAGAVAGGYHVYSCRMPSGAVAPADGWTGSVAGSAYDYALNNCESGGALIAALGDQAKHGADADKAVWEFASPAGEKIAAATLWRAGDNAGGGAGGATYQFWLAGPRESEPFDTCNYTLSLCSQEGDFGHPLSSSNLVAVPSGHLGTSLYLFAFCGGSPPTDCEAGKGNANGYASAVYLYAADILLEQPVGPTATNITGELATAPSVRGASDIAFDATDPASGVYEAVFAIDGQMVQRTVVDDNGGRCRDVGGTSDGRPAFLYVQPCKGSVSVDVPFDTTRVPDGVHHLVVSVFDAAGDSAPVLDRAITVANPPPVGGPNGTNASTQATLAAGWVGSKRARLAGAYGHARAIAGRLTAPGGTPIAGAAIDCMVTPAYQGAKPVAMVCPRTGADGRFAVKVPGGASSRTIRLAYRAHVGDALPVATRTLALVVRAGVRLRVSPPTTSVGHAIHFAGTLLGGPIPREGKPVVLEARSPGGPWIEFDVVRTNRKGRYRDSYTFKFPGPVDYRFRALSEGEADYPYATGSSNVVRVHER